MRVLLTGAAGYIGSTLTAALLANGHEVVGVDNLRYGGESLLSVWTHPLFQLHRIDLTNCDHKIDALLSASPFDAIVHLAAIVGDPACKAEPALAEALNLRATCELAKAGSNHCVPRFVFSSTCSNYGAGGAPDELIDESAPLQPLSHYADLKVRAERYLLQQHEWPAGSAPTILRFATAHGVSSRMRFDLTVNEFAATLAQGHVLDVYNPQAWRPYCHIRDISRAILLVLDADAQSVAFSTFNVGDTSENYRKQMIVDAVSQQIPGAAIRYRSGPDDPRDYRVDFSKIAKTLGFRSTSKVPDTIAHISRMVKLGLLSNLADERFRNA
jgi:nucleoside-diphosphate-sugar epimerase